MKYKKIIIISTDDLDSNINTLFGVRDLLKKGIDIEYWNLSLITYGAGLKCEQMSGVITKTFSSKKEFRKHIAYYKEENPLFLVYMNYCGKTWFCYRELSKYRMDMAYCVNGVMPSINNSSVRKMFFLPIVLRNRFALMIKKLSIFRPLSYQLETCKMASVDYKIGKNTIHIPFNSTDFQHSKKVSAFENAKEYYVFIDQYLPFHPDIRIVGMTPIDSEHYYSRLNQLFQKIEDKFKKEVIIAAHPQSYGYPERNPFNGRKIILGKTNSLVKGCKGVLTHHSTAFYYSILFDKPLLFLTSNDIQKNMPQVHNCSFTYAKLLKATLLNIDEFPELIDFPVVDKFSYNKFKYNYITNPESENLDNADILFDVLDGKYE